jgi:hypothetical protein
MKTASPRKSIASFAIVDNSGIIKKRFLFADPAYFSPISSPCLVTDGCRVLLTEARQTRHEPVFLSSFCREWPRKLLGTKFALQPTYSMFRAIRREENGSGDFHAVDETVFADSGKIQVRKQKERRR